MKNVVILIKNDKMALNWQTPTKVIEYIKNKQHFKTINTTK